ncbi:MAG: ribosome biogenesis GTPase Der [Myxococcales bacterium]|nr:ribosome biogenesis GTPase Der [Myxococcales bacterium]MCB9733107.1 ribosome biogenesis GTPase Der [Deltaproteobacteria bacterium]
MSSMSILAIVGRPNVGKSTLFNRLVGGRKAIVFDEPGVTRDRQYGETEVLGRELLVIDTGGFEPEADDRILKSMREQAQLAIEEADVIVMILDGRDGLLPADREIVRMLERGGKPVHYAVNKIDGARHDPLVAEFWELGVKELWPISAQHGGGVFDLLEAVIADLPEPEPEEEESDAEYFGELLAGLEDDDDLDEDDDGDDDGDGEGEDDDDAPRGEDDDDLADVDRLEGAVDGDYGDDGADYLDEGEPDEDDGDDGVEAAPEVEELGVIKVAIVGKPNVGKSTLLNKLLGEERMLTSNIPGTTRDAIDTKLVVPGRDGAPGSEREYLLIDTAGVRRRKWIRTSVEKISIVRTFKSIDRADVCLLLIDAADGISDQDAKLARLIADKGRACVILLNKWDVVPDKDERTIGHQVKAVRDQLGLLSWSPILSISALTGQRTHKILDLVDEVARNRVQRIKTGALNRFVSEVITKHTPPVHKNRRLKIFYASQVKTAPPIFVLWVNDAEALSETYIRFLQNRIRERWNFEGTPIRVVARARKGKAKEE